MDFYSHIEKLNRDELIQLLLILQEKLKDFGDSGLKKNAKIIVGGKFANHPSFVEEYKGLVGKTAIVKDADIGIYDLEENDNELPCISVLPEGQKYKPRWIHPDDAIVIEG